MASSPWLAGRLFGQEVPPGNAYVIYFPFEVFVGGKVFVMFGRERNPDSMEFQAPRLFPEACFRDWQLHTRAHGSSVTCARGAS